MIKNIPFETLESWPSRKQLSSTSFAHIIAYISTLNNFSYVNGKINSRVYIKDNFKPDDWHKGLYSFLMTEPRGDIIYGKQYLPEYRSYSALVPLILSAHKLMNNIPYSSWSIDGLNAVVNPKLYEVMTYLGKVDFSKEDIIRYRDDGLVVQSGAKKGQRRNPSTAAFLCKPADAPEWALLPQLAKTMLSQTWLAHPDNRTDLMVLHPRNWDVMPEPLDSSEVLVMTDIIKMPWDI